MRCIDGRKRTYPHLRDAGGGGVHPAVRDARPGRAAARRDRRRAVTALGRYVLSGRAPDLSGRDTFSVRVTCGGRSPCTKRTASAR